MVVEGSFGMGRRMEILNMEIIGIKKGIERGLRECSRKNATTLTIQTESQKTIRQAV